MARIRRLDHVGITVADLDTVSAFFVQLGLEVEGRTFLEGDFLDTVIGIPDARTEMVLLRAPAGGAGLELAPGAWPPCAGQRGSSSPSPSGSTDAPHRGCRCTRTATDQSLLGVWGDLSAQVVLQLGVVDRIGGRCAGRAGRCRSSEGGTQGMPVQR